MKTMIIVLSRKDKELYIEITSNAPPQTAD